MRTRNIKIDNEYLYNGEKITVIKRLRRRTNKSDNTDCGNKRFRLSNGRIVHAHELKKIVET